MSPNKKAMQRHLEDLKRCVVDLQISQEIYVDNMRDAYRCQQQDPEVARRAVERADASWQLVRAIESKVTNLTAAIMELCHD